MVTKLLSRRFLPSLLAVLVVGLLLGLAVWPRLAAAAHPDAVTAAWQKARAAGSYHFDSDVIQVTIPSPTVGNIGRSSRTQALHLSGQTDLRQQALEMQLWSDGGSVLQGESSLAVKVEGGQSFVRRQGPAGWGEWQAVENGIDGFAPQGDFLAYLAAVQEVQAHAPETRSLPGGAITFTRYTFTLDGPTFAAFMREQMEEALRAKGELPPTVRLEAADYYRKMQGDGELWVREDGLPLRQILNLTFPEEQEEFVTAQITVDFSRFGKPIKATLAELARMGDLAGLAAALPSALPDPTPALILVTLLAMMVLMMRYRQARSVQIAVATAVITSLVIGPILSTFRVDAFFATQTAKAAAQEGQRAESDIQHSLRALGDRPEFNPHANPLESTEDGIQDTGNGISGFQAANLSIAQSPTLQSLTDNGVDTDGDGLSDFVEARVGADPTVADTDNDGLPDAVEVRGFTYAGKIWYANPLAMDSNNDGISDETEWGRNADGSLRTTPLDTDGDGIPDLFDPDNDNDGVPDRLDLSPFAKGASTASDANPFNLTVKNLAAGRPTFVDFQLRPTTEKHLWFAFNVLDWPRNDNQGQVVDVDGGAYADLAAVEGRTSTANEAGGDMKLIPMLEIRMPANGANLPPQSDLEPYGITVNNVTEDGSQKAAYVPLSLVVDEQSGQRVAFAGRMRYLPTGSWPTAHQVRLAWVVQALVDLPCDQQTDTSADCQDDGYYNNVPQVIQSYYDEWTLTGFNVSEQQGAKTAVIYEDPQFDDNRHDHAGLVALSHALDETFLAARDANNDNQRDITLARIAQDLATLATTWEIPQRFGIENASYATFDQAVMTTAMSETSALLNRVFGSYWSSDPTLKPTLLYAYEQTSRGLSLDATAIDGNYVTANLNDLTVDFQPANQPTIERVTVAGLKWAHYCREAASASWTTCAAEDYWEGLEQLYGTSTLPGDPADPEVQAGRMMILQLYNLSLVQGISNVVQQDNRLISPRYTLKTDPQLATTIRNSAALGSAATVFLVNQSVLASINNTGLVKQLGLLYKPTFGQAREAWKYVSGQTKSGSDLRGSAIGFSIKAVYILGLVTSAILAASLHGQDAKIALRAFVIGLQLNFAVIDPILIAVKWSSALATGGSTASVLKSGSEVLGMSKQALAVGTVIAIAVVWGFFIYSMAANNVTPFSPEFNRALAETIAATIYLVLLALISLTVIGLILVGIVAVIDAILTAICELGVDDLRKAPGLGGACFTLGTTAIKAIAYALYNYDVMIDTNRRDLVAPGSPETRLADPSRGFVTGNELSITMPITTNISHKSPDAANGLMINAYLYFFSPSNLRSTTVKYSLSQPDKEDLSTGLNNMRNEWQNVREHHKYAATSMYGGHATTTPAPITGINLPAGINQTPEFYLNMGYALPAYECWVVPVLGIISAPVCYTRTFSGHNSTKIETLRYDIFPATFAEFVSMAAKPGGGYGLNWDSRFPALVDADGDGLLSSVHGGIDPNDNPNAQGWDTDNDGLSDANEMERRAAGFAFSPIHCDTDGDGLTDAQEAFFGTNPANPDSDNDGLLDSEEVWRQVYNTTTCQPTPAWAGGWDVTINAATPFTVRVTSNPLLADSDGDGIDDLAEKQLAQHADPTKRLDDQNKPYHPGVFNSSPIKIYPATDKMYVRPGDSVAYTNTVVSNVEIAPSLLDVSLPTVFGPSPAPALLSFDPLTFSGSQTVTHRLMLTAYPDLETQPAFIGSGVRARLMDTGAATLGWEPLTPQTLGDASPLTRFSAAAATLTDRQDHFVVSAVLSDSAVRGGKGAIQTNAIPGGVASTLTLDNANVDSPQRGAAAPDTACNDEGACLVVWDQREPCNTLTINYLRVVTSGEGGGIEPVIYWIADYNDTNPADGGYQLLWNPLTNGSRDMGSGVQRGPNANGFPITVNVCGDGRIDVYEADTETITNNPTGMDLIGSSLRIGPDNFNLDPSLLTRFTRSGITSVVDLDLSMTRKNLDTVRGAMVGFSGLVTKSSFAIPAALPTSTAKSHNFRPVVASDGVNYLVVSELVNENTVQTLLDIRRFDAAGNLLGQPTTHLLEAPRVAAFTTPSVALDVAWIGDRYRIAYKYIRASGSQAILIRDWDAAGNPLGAGWTTVTTDASFDERGAPTLAYNPRLGQTLLLYRNSTATVRRMFFIGSSLTPSLPDGNLGASQETGLAITSQDPPQAVYNPLADVWLISWTTPSGVGTGVVYSLWRPDLSGRLVADQKVAMSAINFNSRSQACPVHASQVAADLRFEELPHSNFTKYFADSSGRGNTATCDGDACPLVALPGAVDNLGNPVSGGPQGQASDYAIRFKGLGDVISMPNPVGQTFTVAFWYKSNSLSLPWPFTISSGAGGFALRLYSNTSLIEFQSGSSLLTATPNVRDGQWHFIAATREASGRLALYVDGNATAIATLENSIAPNLPATLQISAGGAVVDLDQLQFYNTALRGSTLRDHYTRSLQAYCIGVSYNLGQYQWRKLNVSTPDVRGGKLTANAELRVTIDGDAPTTTFAGLTTGQYLLGNQVHTIGGYANDATSGVAGVEVKVGNGAFQPARGAATWAYNLAVGEGSYSIQSRAIDVAGNVGAPSTVTVIADATPPNVTLNALPATPTVPTRNAGQWSVTLGGTASDPNIGGQPGSGVQPDSVEVLLVAQVGDDDAQGNGWQQATLNGNNWTLDYRFADGLADPTGVYTIYVRAADRVGNRTADNAATGTLRLDGAAPLATLSEADAVRQLITNTLTIGGVITDTGPAGVGQLEISFVTLEQVAALPVDVSSEQAQTLLDAAGRTWLPATVAQTGSAVTTWSAQIPAGLEGEYQIDLRGTDMLGNRRTSPNLWRGVIDTRAPRLVIEATPTGATYYDEAAGIQRYEFIYTCSAEDRYLVEQDFVCDGAAIQPSERTFTEETAVQALFPDRTILSRLSNTYSQWETSLQPPVTVSACDAFGHCDTRNNQPAASANQVTASALTNAPEPGAPKAVIVAPGHLRYVAGDASVLPVTVAAEAGQGLKEIILALDGVDVHTLSFTQSEMATRIQRTVTIAVAGVGAHTLTARATDWSGATQTTLYPITFKLDTQRPALTLATGELTIADTWQVGSDVLRFHGAASDDVGLAAVQIKVDNQPFVNATFGNGVWRTALPVTDPEGRSLPVTVRAIDFAGQVTQVNHTVPTNLSVADAPDTTITASPANPSNVNTASFEFSGSESAVAFACQLDEGAFTPCASPWTVSDLSKGEHTFRVRAIDDAGYVDLSPASFTWTVNASALDATITAGPANPSSSRNAGFSFTGSGSGFECSLDGAAFSPCTSGVSYTALSYGDHTFAVRAVNGGQTGAADRYTWSIVNTPPVAEDQTLTTLEDEALAVTLSASDEDPLTYQVVAPPAHGVLVGAAPNLLYSPDSGFSGADSFTFRANDGQSESNLATVTIHVTAGADTTPPLTSIALDPAGATGQNEWYVSPVVIRVTASDGSAANASGVAETRCVLNPASAPARFDELPTGCGYLDGGAEVATDGVYVLYAASRDTNDNREAPVSQGFQIDRTPPQVTVTGVSEGGVYPVESAPTPGCDTQDALAGVATAAMVSVSGGNGDGTGDFIATCAGAVDNAGNPAPTVSVGYSVQSAPLPVYLSVVLLGHEGVKLNQKVTVHSGAVVANTASTGPFLDSGVEVSLGQQSSFLGESSLYGDSVKVNQKSTIPAVHYNQLQEGQHVSIGQRVTPLPLPVVELPPFLTASPSANNITVAQNGSLTLAAGSYGLLKVNQKATVIFGGGEYHFAAWEVGQQVNLFFQAPSDIRIAGRLTVGQKSVVGPHPSANALSARDILLYVAGPNGGNGSLSGSPKSAEFGQETALQANIYAPNGAVLVNQKSTVRGALLARWVDIGQEVALTLDSAFATPRAVNASVAFSTAPLPEDEMPEESELTTQSFLPLVAKQ